jgi:alpha-glucosidase
MNLKLSGLMVVLLMSHAILFAQKSKIFEMNSPDGNISLSIEAGTKLLWSVKHNGQQMIAPSAISIQLQGGEILGDNAKIISSPAVKVNDVIIPVNYKKASIPDQYNQLTINCKNDFGVIFRVYNEGMAYRFFTKKGGEIIVINEEANFNFTGDYKAFIPFMWDYRGGKIFNSSFEALYREIKISQFANDSLAFLPVLVDAGNNKKVVILEADLEDYPGMYLNINHARKGFMGVYAPYPLETEIGGYGSLNLIPTKRAGYIAKTNGTRNFPWRVIVISKTDKELLNNDMVQKLAAPSRIADMSWITPGQVSWDWWNNWNISHVDFKAGINTPTYKYYIDFAAANKVKYIIMDDGWSERADLTKISPEINLQEIVDYGKQKGVGVILWASWQALLHQMDVVLSIAMTRLL